MIELADYLHLYGISDLRRDGFEKEPPLFKCKVAELSEPSSQPVVGYALFFPTYSTWEGSSMMLEDLYVRGDHRLKGVGKKLFKAVAKVNSLVPT